VTTAVTDLAGRDPSSKGLTASETRTATSTDERRRRVAESLRVGNPGNNAHDLAAQADPHAECQIQISVEQVRPYEHNPRRASNAKFAAIKASIRESGICTPLTVTKRPSEHHFIIESGGNTRLLALRQLWAETRDPRFATLTAMFRPWRSESHVLTAHLIENEHRADMTFWDRAVGVVGLKARIEVEQGSTLSVRQLREAMQRLGLEVDTATLTHYLFAVQRLRPLGDAVLTLSGLHVRTMQPRLNALKRYAMKRKEMAEGELYAAVFDPVLEGHAKSYQQTGRFDPLAVCAACEAALAAHLGESIALLRAHVHLDGRGSVACPSADDIDTSEVTPTGRRASQPPTAPDGVCIANATHRTDDCAAAVEAATTVAGGNGLIANLIEQIEIFVSLSGIADQVRKDAQVPFGLSVQPFSDRGEDADAGRQCAARALAAVLAECGTAALVATPSSTRVARGDVQIDLVTAFDSDGSDPSLLAWLLETRDADCNAFWNVLNACRTLKKASADQARSME